MSYIGTRTRWLYWRAAAIAKGKSFFCKALSGLSNYNITIQSDMSVSCNCADYDGEGVLGSLKDFTFKEIFDGPKAMEIRKMLAKGKIPIFSCMYCSELTLVEKDTAEKYVHGYNLPKRGLAVGEVVDCNCNCIGCRRKQMYKRVKKRYMSIDEVTNVANILRDLKIEELSYFNYGEPFMSKHFNESVNIIKKANPTIKIIVATNGLLMTQDIYEGISKLDSIYISLDGIDDKTVTKYQRGSNFQKVYTNICEFVTYRDNFGFRKPLVVWKYVVFNWNDRKEMIEEAISYAKSARVDRILFSPTGNPRRGRSIRYWTSKHFHEIPYHSDGYQREIILR
jgi:pyruvate-formate lyase-activating enzyme